ncbi:MAG: hypothetical protein JXO49_09630 [Deltaproteobacteria bacterium]|nr:hypothetical protein [Candidatus Anaeroferrophillus wilburensis]MBN2889592.1 hypothetical protein [Deltaproteobacteria bacterium]
MKVKHFRGENINQVMQEVKREFGRDAVILETRQEIATANAGALVEIVAAIDFPDQHVAGVAKGKPTICAVSGADDDRCSLGQSSGWWRGGGYRELRREVQLMKGMLNRLLETTGVAGEWTVSDAGCNLYQHLLGQGLAEEVARTLLDQVMAQLPPAVAVTREMLMGCLARYLIDNVPLFAVDRIGRLVTLVGPTGVGKTTSVAKLAAFFQHRGERVGLITVDAFRLGALAQIKEYARRLRIPVCQVKNRVELEQALCDFGAMDRIIVDTTGRSHHDDQGLQALKQILPADQGTSFLVVPAGIREDDLLDVLVQFRRFSYGALLFTKLDETMGHGMLLRGSQIANLPLAFFATGQLVPEDFEEATGERVASLLLNIG